MRKRCWPAQPGMTISAGRKRFLLFDEEGIAVAFLADGGGKSEEFADERLHDCVHRAAPQIGAADAARKERVTREKDRRCDGNFAGVGRKQKAGTARRV